ncbi:MAG TPA: hypothetical protein VGB85_02685 [Nannocystis sp.]
MTPPTPPTRAWSRGHVLAGLAALLAFGTALGACFNPPAAAVMFSCDPAAATCPDGYTCEADGCCHRDGSDVEADFGGCGLGKGASAGPTTMTTATTGAPDTTDAPTTGTTADTTSGSSSSSASSTGSEPDTGTTGTTSGTSSGSSSAGMTE